MITLFNPTNEDLEGHHAGENVKVLSGSKLKVEDGRGNHLLNNLGPRGLTSLEYGDNEDLKSEEGIKRNKEFKLKQVMDYNHQNETRKSVGLSHITPPDHVLRYAEELGVKLMKAFTMTESENYKDKAADEERFRKLENQMSSLAEAVSSLVTSLSEKEEKKEEGVTEVIPPKSKKGK